MSAAGSPSDRSADARDRRTDGRPEQTRPRDRTGRPLPYDTTEIELTEDHEPATVEEALELGRQLWNQRRFFEAHELLEHVWHAAPEDDRDLWQGVIQVAVAAVHLQRENHKGAVALLHRAESRLARYPDLHRGIEVEALRRAALDLAQRAQQATAAQIPAFPAADGGAWFTPDPTALRPPTDPTPIPDEPSWRAAGRRRAPRRRDDEGTAGL